MFNQSLPTYIHNFETDKRWKNFSSEHYVFHYFTNSEAEKDLKKIVQKQEKAYKKIIEFLDVPDPKKPIEYFFYPDKETKKSLMGDDWYAQSIYNEFRIHVLYTKDDKPLGEHEDTHLLSLPWGLSAGFFQEGLAEFMVEHAWDGVSHLEYAKKGYAENIFSSISDLMNHEVWINSSEKKMIYWYSLAGAFTSFLINKFGKEKFEKLYKETNRNKSKEENSAIFKSIYGWTLDIIENDFKKNYSKIY